MAWKEKAPVAGAKLREARRKRTLVIQEAEERARVMIENEVKAIDNVIDTLVREMNDKGATLAEIKRAYGTKDHATIKAILDRTLSMSDVTPKSDKYSYDDSTKILSVNYTDHGAEELTGTATIGVWDDKQGGIMFLPFDGVTSDVFDNRIAKLLTPLAQDNEYRAEALAFMETQVVTLEKSPKIVLDIPSPEEEDGGNDLRKFLSEAEDDELGGFE